MKPGTIQYINGTPARVKRQNMDAESACEGCMFDNITSCPNIYIEGKIRKSVDCVVEGMIFVKP